MPTHRIGRENSDYPKRVARRLGADAPDAIEFLGPVRIPEPVPVGLICSVSCPGSVIIRTYDAIRALRDAGIVVAGGFHSPMESECLEFLSRGSQVVVVCVATGVEHVVLGAESHAALLDNRLCVLSPFGNDVEHATPWHGARRNDLVTAIADVVFLPHAVPGGKAEANAFRVLTRGQTLLTFDDVANKHLVRAGARPVLVPELVAVVREVVGTPG